MDKNLTALKPALVWKHFAEIAKIPRPSSHEEKIRAYVIGVAKSLGLECKEDAAHNVYVRKPASKGMENRKGIVLQAHLDMVPQKNNDKKFDFTKDPIEAYIDGQRYDARCGQRYRCGGYSCRPGGRYARTRSSRSAFHSDRGDGYGRCVRPEERGAAR